MNETALLNEQFEANRSHLKSVAYRMLGSLSEADDAVQDAWIRVSRVDTSGVENLGGYLTTVVARVCLNMLQSRKTRREDSLDDYYVPDPVVSRAEGTDPEEEVLLADSVGLGLLVVLEMLTPTERLAFVLHDVFAVPFEEIAPIVDKTPAAARQLASRARRRVQGRAPMTNANPLEQRRVVDAFFAAARDGDFNGLVALLDPDIVLRSDGGSQRPNFNVLVRGAAEVAGRAMSFHQPLQWVHPALINGTAGAVVAPHGRVVSVLSFTVRDGRIVAIEALADPVRLAKLDLSAAGL
ncbi:MAG: RNA polymerase sigma factor SigJ [Dehalococcoidia bacterium]